MMVMSESRDYSASDEWTLIDKDVEFESVCAVLESKDMGKALQDENDLEISNTFTPEEIPKYTPDEIAKILEINMSLKQRLERVEAECLHWELKSKQFSDSVKNTLPPIDLHNRIICISKQVNTIHSYLRGDSLMNPPDCNDSTCNADVLLKNVEEKLSSSLTFITTRPSYVESNDLKICLTTFQNNDIGLFFPTPKGDFLAFHLDSPHHYLSEESKSLIGHHKHFRKQYVLGRIILKEEHVATPSISPYRLPPGTVYYTCSVTSVVGDDK